MGSRARDDEGVNPTVRWLFQGLWKVGFVLLVFFLAGVVVTLVARVVN